MTRNMGDGQERLKDIVEKEAEEEEKQQEEEEAEDINLRSHEHEIALKGAYRSFVMTGQSMADIDSFFGQAKPHIRSLIKNQRKVMGSPKIIMTLRVL